MARLERDTSGVVMIEFLIAFVPVLLLTLGTTQLALIAVADLVMHHAVVAGARSASVVLCDDARFYGDEPAGTLAEAGGSNDDTLRAALGLSGPSAIDIGERRFPGPRLAAIRRAVSVPLSVVAPDASRLGSFLSNDARTLAGALSGLPTQRLASALLVYDPVALAVTLPRAPGGSTLHHGRVRTRNATVRATYLFHCGVPLGATLLCSTLGDLQRRASAGDRPTAQALMELSHAPAASAQALLRSSNARFRLLRAEATLPLQLKQSELDHWGAP